MDEDDAGEALASLKTNRALELLAAYPQAMLTVLGLEAVLQLASNSESEFACVRTRALQALCLEVPEAERPPLAALVVRAFWDDGGADAPDAVLRVAPWLPPHGALSLYSASLDGSLHALDLRRACASQARSSTAGSDAAARSSNR